MQIYTHNNTRLLVLYNVINLRPTVCASSLRSSYNECVVYSADQSVSLDMGRYMAPGPRLARTIGLLPTSGVKLTILGFRKDKQLRYEYLQGKVQESTIHSNLNISESYSNTLVHSSS